MPEFHFHERYRIQAGDNLTKVGRAKGFDNPGPIVAYPPNATFFRGRSLDMMRVGEQFLIPYRPDLLRQIIRTSQELIPQVAQMAKELMDAEKRNKKTLENFLMAIDAINFVAGLGASLGMQSAKSAAAASRAAGAGADDAARMAEQSADDILKWLKETSTSVAGGTTTMVVPAPTAPKQDFSFWVRHTLGPWNPSYWTSVFAAVKENDLDLYLYGADAVTYRNCKKIQEQADEDIDRLKQKMQAAEQQLTMPFYSHRI